MTIASSLVVTVSARTEDFERGMQKTTAPLRLTEAQASQVAAGFGNLGQVLTRAGQNGAAGANGIGRMTQSLGGLDAASQKTQGGLGGLGSGISGAMLAVAAVVPQVAGAVIALDLLKKGFEFLAESAVKSQQISAT